MPPCCPLDFCVQSFLTEACRKTLQKSKLFLEISFRSPDSATPSKVGLVEFFPASGPPNKQKSLPPQQQESFDNASDDEFMDGGTCTAVYDFDGKHNCFNLKMLSYPEAVF